MVGIYLYFSYCLFSFHIALAANVYKRSIGQPCFISIISVLFVGAIEGNKPLVILPIFSPFISNFFYIRRCYSANRAHIIKYGKKRSKKTEVKLIQNIYLPEGMLITNPKNTEYVSTLKGLTRAMACGAVVEGYVTLCDSDMRLHVDLGGVEGIIEREECEIGRASCRERV